MFGFVRTAPGPDHGERRAEAFQGDSPVGVALALEPDRPEAPGDGAVGLAAVAARRGQEGEFGRRQRPAGGGAPGSARAACRSARFQ